MPAPRVLLRDRTIPCVSTATDSPAPGRRLARHAPMAVRVGIACLAAAVVVALAAHVGGYLPSAWGLIGVGGAVVAAIALALGRPVGLRRIEAGWIVCLAALGGWQLLSMLWTSGDGGAVADAQVTLLYAVCAAAILALVGRDDAESLVLGVAAGALIVSLWGLGRHLLPETLGGEGARLENPRLAGPMGYTNAAGALAAIGLLLCIAVVTHRGRVLQAIAGAAVAPLAVTLFVTLSRGAMLATFVGLAVVALADRRRLDLAVSVAVVAVPAALAVWLAGRLPGITGSPPYEVMREDGRTLAIELLPVVALGAALGAGRRLVPALGGRSRRQAARVALVAGVVVVAGAALLLAREGGPADLVRRAVDSFSAAPPADANSSARLLSGSGTVRSAYWGVARDMVGREPLLGEGAGSYERWWMQDRPEEAGVRNAHNLYLEMLAETGPLSLLLVLAFVARAWLLTYCPTPDRLHIHPPLMERPAYANALARGLAITEAQPHGLATKAQDITDSIINQALKIKPTAIKRLEAAA